MLRSILIAALVLAPALALADSYTDWNADLSDELTEWEMSSATDLALAEGFNLGVWHQSPAPVEIIGPKLRAMGFDAADHSITGFYSLGGIVPNKLVLVVQVRGRAHEIAGLDGQRLLAFTVTREGALSAPVLDTAAMQWGWKRNEIVSVQQDRILKYSWDGKHFREIKAR